MEVPSPFPWGSPPPSSGAEFPLLIFHTSMKEKEARRAPKWWQEKERHWIKQLMNKSKLLWIKIMHQLFPFCTIDGVVHVTTPDWGWQNQLYFFPASFCWIHVILEFDKLQGIWTWVQIPNHGWWFTLVRSHIAKTRCVASLPLLVTSKIFSKGFNVILRLRIHTFYRDDDQRDRTWLNDLQSSNKVKARLFSTNWLMWRCLVMDRFLKQIPSKPLWQVFSIQPS